MKDFEKEPMMELQMAAMKVVTTELEKVIVKALLMVFQTDSKMDSMKVVMKDFEKEPMMVAGLAH